MENGNSSNMFVEEEAEGINVVNKSNNKETNNIEIQKKANLESKTRSHNNLNKNNNINNYNNNNEDQTKFR